MGLKDVLLPVAYVVSYILLSPFFILYWSKIFRYSTISSILAFIPSYAGVIIRRVWYSYTLKKCGTNLYVDFMGNIRYADTTVGNNCYIGCHTWVSLADIGDDALISGFIIFLSGKEQHFTSREKLFREQTNPDVHRIKIGKDVWIGAGAIIMADIADGTAVGAGSVVNKTFEPYSIIAGVPAKVIKKRE
ncbi:MAG: acyltransferase [Planctomycetes bacterium]|nr:acyltransferase [Planctomycetota bacterium]